MAGKVKTKPKKNRKLTNMARKQLNGDGMHGDGKSDATTPKTAGPGAKLYQVG